MNKKQKRDLDSLIQGSFIIFTILVYLITKSGMLTFIVLVLSLCAFIIFISYRNAKKKERLIKSGIKDIDEMTGKKFEHYLDVLFKKKGYKSYVTKDSGDYGADLILKKDGKKIVVQAKRYEKNVGIKAVQEASSAQGYYKSDESWVVTNSGFTTPAINLAKSNNVKLIGREELISLILDNKNN